MLRLNLPGTLNAPRSADGFEIVNAAPKANEFSRAHRDSVVALARKLLIALWRFVTTGDVPQGMVLRPAS